MKRFVTMVLALAMALSIMLVPSVSAESAFNTADGNYPWNDPSYADTSDLPAWTGKKLNLTWWMGHGIGNLPVEVSDLDVVWPEIERVTGVSINFEDSYSNGDNTFDIKMAMLAGTKDWPDICTNPQLVTPFVDGEVIYDLTDLVTMYYPSALKYMEDPNFKTVWKNPATTGGREGRIYGLPFNINGDYSINKRYLGIEEDDPKYMAAFAAPPNYHQACVKVRDDILKMIFPEAKTQDEIEALYMEQGYFTKEDVFDVPIRSMDDFVKFLRDINDLGLKEGNMPVYPTYAMCGIDNYPLGARLASMLLGWGTGGDCFTHWDNEKKEIVLSTTTPEFRDLYKTFNQLIREGVIPQESLIDDDSAFLAKMNNGQYALTYAEWRWADDDVLKQAGKPYRYRYVYFDIPVDTSRFVQPRQAPGFNQLLIFKDKVAEEDLPQILMMMDYVNSALYHKMKYWGPRDAGLFTEESGVRQFVDSALADEMVSNTYPELRMKYALQNGFYNAGYLVRRPEFGIWFATMDVPYMSYEQERKPEDANIFFKSGLVETYPTVLTELPWIWNFPNAVPGVEKMWAARTTWEDTLMRTLAAQNEEEFDALYDDFLKIQADIGLNNEAVAAMNEYFKEFNEMYMDDLMAY